MLGKVAAVALSGVARLPQAVRAEARDERPPELVHRTILVTAPSAPMLGSIVDEGRVAFSRTSRDGAATALNQLGILLFLACACTNAGDDLVAALQSP